MNGPLLSPISHRTKKEQLDSPPHNHSWFSESLCALVLISASSFAGAQAITIDKQGNAIGGTASSAPVDRRYAQIQPTHVALTNSELDAKTRQELIRVMQAEQGFAMRPFPRGHKGLTLVANGELNPAGEDYLAMVTSQGLCAKPGDRVVLTDVKFDHTKIVFDLNGGPDLKHRFLRHVQLGTGTTMGPVVQDENQGQEATGARLTLVFKEKVPELTGAQVKALLAPLISFDVKTPIEAFTDTLPPKLKEAILNHHVMVGMSTEMVLFAKGQPESKTRETEGQMPFEEWIYGRPPKDVEFVRINGNRVIRVEIAKIGEPPVVYTKDEVEGLMRTDGTPLTAAEASGTHTVQIGDVQRNPDTQAPAAPPSLRKPGEQAPAGSSNDQRIGVMKPVEFPKQKPDDAPDASKLPRTPQAQDDTISNGADAKTTKPADGSQNTPASPAPDANKPQ